MAGLPEQPQEPEAVAEQVARLEARLARVEAKVGIAGAVEAPLDGGCERERSELPSLTFAATDSKDDELERQIGQPAFTLASVIALTSGLGFLLSLPHPNLPPAAPAIAGLVSSSVLLGVAHLLQKKIPALGGYVRGAALLLLYFATLRFFFFGREPALDPDSIFGSALLLLVTVTIAVIAWRARSRWLVLLALLMGTATALTVGSGVLFVAWLPLIASAAILIGWRWQWPALAFAAIPLVHVTYLLWAIGNPLLRGGVARMGWMRSPRC
jgi:hypothetical protein